MGSERIEHKHHAPQSAGQPTLVIVAGLIIALLLGGLLGYSIAGNMAKQAIPSPTPSIKADSAAVASKVMAYLNDNFLTRQGYSGKLKSVSESQGFYQVMFDVIQNGSTIASDKVYTTPDGSTVIIGNILSLNQAVPTPTPAAPQVFTKSAKPEVKLFVMSMCPYGLLAEDAMIPVIKLLGSNANFDIRFIASGSNGTFDSLHGPTEVTEDKRQVCISANEPAKYLAYLECFVKEPAAAINANNAQAYQNTNWTGLAAKCVTQTGIDAKKLGTCMNGAQANDLLSKNIALANQLNIGSSPTIIVNDAAYEGARSSEAFKSAVCNAFSKVPGECSQQLSSASASTGNVACGAS